MTVEGGAIIYVAIVTLIISLSGNFFIIVVNLLDFYKNRRLPLSDQLIFGYSMFGFLHGFLDIFQTASKKYVKKTGQALMYFNMCTLCFSALLSMHFCLKIVNFNHWFYIGLQRRFPKVIPRTLITCIVVYILLPHFSEIGAVQECLNTTSTAVSMKVSLRCSWSSLIILIICVLCSVLCLVSALTIVISLFKHIKRIQGNAVGSRSPNMEAHIRTVKTVTTLLFAKFLIFHSVFFSSVLFVINETSWAYLFSILIPICRIFSSYFLIKGTKKLDTALVELLNQCSCFTVKNW